VEITIHPAAEKELEESIDYYASIEKSLALRFWDEFTDGIDKIKHSPDVWALFGKTCRRFLINRFPYAIIYRVKPNSIEIVAVMHLKRKPGYWINRIE
jgi:toxin ParE1/3/4